MYITNHTSTLVRITPEGIVTCIGEGNIKTLARSEQKSTVRKFRMILNNNIVRGEHTVHESEGITSRDRDLRRFKDKVAIGTHGYFYCPGREGKEHYCQKCKKCLHRFSSCSVKITQSLVGYATQVSTQPSSI